MSAFDDLLEEARLAGVQEDWITRVKAASDGSPLRKERDEWKQKAESHAEKAARYEKATIGQFLATAGFKGKPDALNIPADLDPLDPAALTTWAVDMGLIDPPAPSTEEQERQAELKAHGRVDAASAGTTTPGPKDEARQKALAAQTEAEFYAAARAGGFVTDQ